MRLVVGLTLAFFVGILVVALVCAERAHPVMLDVDPATMRSGHAEHAH